VASEVVVAGGCAVGAIALGVAAMAFAVDVEVATVVLAF